MSTCKFTKKKVNRFEDLREAVNKQKDSGLIDLSDRDPKPSVSDFRATFPPK